jgi:hypothetical protein
MIEINYNAIRKGNFTIAYTTIYDLRRHITWSVGDEVELVEL